jgi:Cys-tRNA(Pro)/Cys-tRNA(Cys) deacylase
MKIQKTNAMRLLSQAGISFDLKTYPVDEADLSGTTVAAEVGLPPSQVYKTLVAKGDHSGYLVCMIPVDREIDLKRLAVASDNKRVELIPAKDLLTITGYVRGGCSPVGMKKKFPTFIEEAAFSESSIAVSAGVRGCQMIVRPTDLAAFTSARSCRVCRDEGME